MPRFRRPSPATVLALFAIVLASAGTGFAASKLAVNSVGSPQLKPGSVGTSELKRNAVTSSRVKDGTLRRRDFKAGVLGGGPMGPTGPTGATGPAGSLSAQQCPPGEFVRGIDGSGQLICADPNPPPCTDADGDGFCVEDTPGDCDDGDAAVNPDATEIPNGVDDDCDGNVDEGSADADADGYPDTIDCAPNNPAINPGATENTTNGVDDDCDGQIDEGASTVDADGDGFSQEQGDCDDADPLRNPAAAELPNGIDDDCDGTIDEGF